MQSQFRFINKNRLGQIGLQQKRSQCNKTNTPIREIVCVKIFLTIFHILPLQIDLRTVKYRRSQVKVAKIGNSHSNNRFNPFQRLWGSLLQSIKIGWKISSVTAEHPIVVNICTTPKRRTHAGVMKMINLIALQIVSQPVISIYYRILNITFTNIMHWITTPSVVANLFADKQAPIIAGLEHHLISVISKLQITLQRFCLF